MARAAGDEPFVDNYPELAEWLKQHEAVAVAQLPCSPRRPTAYFLEVWEVQGVHVVIRVHADRRGWDIFTPCGSNRIDETLRDADQRIKAAR